MDVYCCKEVELTTKTMLLTGNCGNLTFKNRDFQQEIEKTDWHVKWELGSIEELKKAMTSIGNYKLDLKVTLTVAEIVTDTGGDEQWIIPRYNSVFYKSFSVKNKFSIFLQEEAET